ncbi:hypothetical protein RAB80_017734 [Fusarium oxysporum f. sp. vasinfectum]|nr:hypothetical protein RAB80_017734 [Fusarium oxysporum f. sp. vasinfectum]
MQVLYPLNGSWAKADFLGYVMLLPLPRTTPRPVFWTQGSQAGDEK